MRSAGTSEPVGLALALSDLRGEGVALGNEVLVVGGDAA
jgi:hypothetical protein